MAIVGDCNLSGDLLAFLSMSMIDVNIAYSVPRLRHLIVPHSMVDRLRELDSRLTICPKGGSG